MIQLNSRFGNDDITEEHVVITTVNVRGSRYELANELKFLAKELYENVNGVLLINELARLTNLYVERAGEDIINASAYGLASTLERD